MGARSSATWRPRSRSILMAAAVWASAQVLQPVPPRRLVLALVNHQCALHYQEILSREGVAIEEWMTGGARDNP
jgi:hypothetical protein